MYDINTIKDGKKMKSKVLEPKKAWKTPKLIVHGDVEKITREAQIPGPAFVANPSLR